MNKTKISIGTILVGFLISLLGCISEERIKQAEADRMGPAALTPEMTFGDLKKALHAEWPVVSGGGSVKNIITVDFGDGLVYATFLHHGMVSERPDPPSDFESPIRLIVHKPFNGTVCGVTIGTSVNVALEKVRKAYPYAEIDGGAIKLNGLLQTTWFLYVDANEVHVETNEYILLPG